MGMLVAALLASVAALVASVADARMFVPAFALLPLAVAVVAGIDPEAAVSSWVSGIRDILGTALFLYSVVFFFKAVASCGYVDRLSRRVTGWLRDRSSIVTCLVSALFALACGLPGSPAVAYASSIGCLKPLFASRGLRALDLSLIVSLAVGTSIMWPWSSKSLVLSGIAGAPAAQLWVACAPMQLTALALTLFVAVAVGMRGNLDGGRSDVGESAAPVAGASTGDSGPRYSDIALWAVLVAVLALAVARPAWAWIAVSLAAFVVSLAGARCSKAGSSAMLAGVRAALPGPRIVFQTLAVGAYASVVCTMFGAADLGRLLPALDARDFAWTCGAVMAVGGVFLPYQLVYALAPLAMSLSGSYAPVTLCAPFVPMLCSTVSPSVPSTAVIDAALGTSPMSHVRRNALPVCAAQLIVLGVGRLCWG